MPEAKTLAVGVAILTILGMTIALAVPMGPSFTGDDDPDNSGVTSAQEEPVNNTTDNGPNGTNGTNGNGNETVEPGENDTNNGSESPPCESNGESDDSSDSSDCDSSGDDTDDQDGEKDKDHDDGNDGTDDDSTDDDSTDDQDGEKDKDHDDGTGEDGDDSTDDDSTDDQDGEKDKDHDDGTGEDGDNGNETDDGTGDNETNVTGTCEEGGLVMNNTLANELFGTENESGPLSSVIHENEHYFMQGDAIVHESGCVVATLDNAANGTNPGDQIPGSGNDSENSTSGNETENSTNDEDGTVGDTDPGTCETGGAIQNATLANALFGTENESGPLSSVIHENEHYFMQGNVLIHEGGCVVATLDNNTPGGSDIPEAP